MKNLTYKAIDVMKKSKDTVTSQLTTAEKANLVARLATVGITHIAISVPMDIQSEFIAFGTTPSPRTISGETQDWCDVIHAQLSVYGTPLKVIHRGTFCGVEAIWGSGYIDGGLPIGTQASAPTDGTSTLLGRWYLYLNTNVGASHVLDGDIFAPIPEGSTHAFDGHYWWPAGSQANYVSAYSELHALTNTFGSANSKTLVFMTHDNFSEVASGWMPAGRFSDQNLAGADYYGQRQGSTFVTPADYVYDWEQLYLGLDSNGGGGNAAGGYPQFWGEWGDLPEGMPAGTTDNETTWSAFLNSFYSAIRDNLVTPNGHMIGFNYWGGWEAQNTSILDKTGSGAGSNYTLNFRGVILQTYFTEGITTTSTSSSSSSSSSSSTSSVSSSSSSHSTSSSSSSSVSTSSSSVSTSSSTKSTSSSSSSSVSVTTSSSSNSSVSTSSSSSLSSTTSSITTYCKPKIKQQKLSVHVKTSIIKIRANPQWAKRRS